VNKSGATAVSCESADLSSMGRPRVLYVMHIDWDFIWQRPQELAKQLAEEYDVRVAFAYDRHHNVMRHNDRSGLVVRPFLQLPLAGRSALIAACNGVLLRVVLGAMVRSSRADVIWLCHPLLVEYIPRNYRGKIVYDCMDDALAFTQPAAVTERMRRDEARLVARADLILTSSMSLGDTLRSRHGASVHTLLVRNGCSGNSSPVTEVTSRGADQLWHLGYIGTMANVDVEAITKLVKSLPDVCIDLVGPGPGWTGPTDYPRLRLFGTLQHERLWKFASTCCCLIAPFLRTKLTEGQDPVKLYEYVSWGRPIVVLRYPEVERFGAFVEFYETPQELVEVVSRMCSEGFVRKYSEEQRTEFLKENTWEARGRQVRQELRDLLSGVDG
jgi:teichuronic acid biosynthesis glycosyltransferase TuaH